MSAKDFNWKMSEIFLRLKEIAVCSERVNTNFFSGNSLVLQSDYGDIQGIIKLIYSQK